MILKELLPVLKNQPIRISQAEEENVLFCDFSDELRKKKKYPFLENEILEIGIFEYPVIRMIAPDWSTKGYNSIIKIIVK